MLVGGFTQIKRVTPVIQAAAYASGDLVGGKNEITFASRIGTGVIQSLVLVDQANQKVAVDVYFFDADPSNTTFTENGALDIADADMSGKLIGRVSIATGDYVSAADNAEATVNNIGLPFVLAGSSLYFALVSRGAPTYAATSDLVLVLGLLLD